MIDAFTISPVYAPPPMHDKPQPAPAHEFRLSDHDLLSICGRDAIAFAQAQFMNDVAALGDGQWQWNGWLTAKGRVIALFALLRLDAQTLWLLLPDVAAADLATGLQRFVFRSKLKLARVDACIVGNFATPGSAQTASLARRENGSLQLDMSGEGAARTLEIRQDRVPDDLDAVARWQACDLAHGLPRLPATQAEQWTPQQLSLDRLNAYSVKKGCYPGQEIVARTHFLGQAKRGLVLLEADAALAAGDEVLAEGRAIGSLIAASGTRALAVLPLERPSSSLQASGNDLREQPLTAGLSR